MRTIAPSSYARRPSGVELRPNARFVPSVLRRASLYAAGIAALSFLFWLSACAPSKGTIGAVIAQEGDSGRLFLRDVPASLAAGQANLKPGDEILLIDGLDVRRLDAQQINAALSGEVGAPVKLTLIREEQVLRVTLLRTEAQRLAKKLGKSQ